MGKNSFKKGNIVCLTHEYQQDGIVVDEAGKPLRGVSVSIPVLGSFNWNSPEVLPHTETTDAKIWHGSATWRGQAGRFLGFP